MDFRSAFLGHDFSVLIFGSAIFLALMVQLVLLIAATVDTSEGHRVPTWGWVTMVIVPLVVGALGYGLYVTS